MILYVWKRQSETPFGCSLLQFLLNRIMSAVGNWSSLFSFALTFRKTSFWDKTSVKQKLPLVGLDIQLSIFVKWLLLLLWQNSPVWLKSSSVNAPLLVVCVCIPTRFDLKDLSVLTISFVIIITRVQVCCVFLLLSKRFWIIWESFLLLSYIRKFCLYELIPSDLIISVPQSKSSALDYHVVELIDICNHSKYSVSLALIIMVSSNWAFTSNMSETYLTWSVQVCKKKKKICYGLPKQWTAGVHVPCQIFLPSPGAIDITS